MNPPDPRAILIKDAANRIRSAEDQITKLNELINIWHGDPRAWDVTVNTRSLSLWNIKAFDAARAAVLAEIERQLAQEKARISEEVSRVFRAAAEIPDKPPTSDPVTQIIKGPEKAPSKE